MPASCIRGCLASAEDKYRNTAHLNSFLIIHVALGPVALVGNGANELVHIWQCLIRAALNSTLK